MRCTAIRPDVAGVWRALGNAYRDNAEGVRSREALERSIALSSDHAATYIDLAKTCRVLGDHPAAESAARQALKLGSGAAAAQYELGQALLAQERTAEALVAFEESQRVSQDNPRIAAHWEPSIPSLIDECRRKLSLPDVIPPKSTSQE